MASELFTGGKQEGADLQRWLGPGIWESMGRRPDVGDRSGCGAWWGMGQDGPGGLESGGAHNLTGEASSPSLCNQICSRYSQVVLRIKQNAPHSVLSVASVPCAADKRLMKHQSRARGCHPYRVPCAMCARGASAALGPGHFPISWQHPERLQCLQVSGPLLQG